ncbi:hypothetical protein PT2222_150281 [Paraburkholderia tropica]
MDAADARALRNRSGRHRAVFGSESRLHASSRSGRYVAGSGARERGGVSGRARHRHRAIARGASIGQAGIRWPVLGLSGKQAFDEGDEGARLRRCHAPGRKHRPYVDARQRPVGERGLHGAVREFRREHPFRGHGQSQIGEDGGAHAFGRADPHAARHRDGHFGAVRVSERPRVSTAAHGVNDCPMLTEFRGRLRRAMPCEIRLRADHQTPSACDAPRGHRGVVESAHAQRDVDAFLEQIDRTVVHHDLHIESRVLFEERAKRGDDVQPCEGHGRAHAQPPDQSLRRLAHRMFRAIGFFDRQTRVFVEALASIGGGEAAGRAQQEARVQMLFELRDRLRYGGLSDMQPTRRRRERTRLYDGDEGFHCGQAIHAGGVSGVVKEGVAGLPDARDIAFRTDVRATIQQPY